jgi:uncharacterized membrane protein YgcG
MFLVASCGVGAEEEFPIPPAPDNRVLDEARLFARNPERLAMIAETLAALEARHRYRLYFAIYDTLIGRTLKDQAALLQGEWLAGQPGLVLVLEVDSFKFQFGQAPPATEEIEPGNTVERARPTDFAPIELERIIAELAESLQAATSDRQLFAEALSTGVAGRISVRLDERAAAPAAGTRTRMVALAIGLLAVTGLLALLVVAGLKRVEARARERLVFPRVAVGMRLGAPYGGGKVSSRSFGGPK